MRILINLANAQCCGVDGHVHAVQRQDCSRTPSWARLITATRAQPTSTQLPTFRLLACALRCAAVAPSTTVSGQVHSLVLYTVSCKCCNQAEWLV